MKKQKKKIMLQHLFSTPPAVHNTRKRKATNPAKLNLLLELLTMYSIR